jgi:hypothetical protein
VISSGRLLSAAPPVAAFAITLAACSSGDGTGPPENRPVPPVLRIVAGANVTDTVESRPLQALVVEVRDSTGGPLRGAVVRFDALLEGRRAVVFVAPLTSANYLPFAADSTDASGRAHVLLAFGTLAGPARVAIHVPALGLTDTARFTVTPGAAAKIVFSTRDTLLTVGKRFSPNASITDRFNNPRPGSLSYRSLSIACSVDSTGQITGLASGRCAVEVRADADADTARASFVPDGTMVVFLPESGTGRGEVATVSFDGSNLRRLTTVLQAFQVFPAGTRGGSSVVYREADRLMVVEASVTRELLMPGGGGPSWAGFARFSRDSAWVYFAGNDAIHRVRRDGSGYERIMLPGGSGSFATTPDPSPDGTRVAFNGGSFIRIHTLGATSPAIHAGEGAMPRWSPRGDRIAFFSAGRIAVVDADGRNRRDLTTGFTYYDNAGLDWTADGSWIVARGAHTIDLIEVATGQVIPLLYSSNALQPSVLR